MLRLRILEQDAHVRLAQARPNNLARAGYFGFELRGAIYFYGRYIHDCYNRELSAVSGVLVCYISRRQWYTD